MNLRVATLLFLYAPLALFVAGWLRGWIALPLLLAMAAAAFAYRGALAEPRPRARTVALAALVACLWAALGGSGGVGYQRDDWQKHNAVLKDLIEKPWPATYEVEERPGEGIVARPLVFYLAYYLPSALVGKAFGWPAANLALFATTWVGATLALLWFARLVPARAAVGPMGFFVVAGGVEIVGYLLGKGFAPPGPRALDWWAYPWNLATNSGQLYWAPHQALGGWLATALVLDGYLGGASTRTATLEAFGAAFWSPLATIGLLPFWVARVARAPREHLASWPNWTLFPLLAALLSSYYASLHQAVPVRFLGHEIVGRYWIRFAALVVLEWGALLAFCRPWTLAAREARRLVALAVASLLAIPLLSVGLFNDFCMRASIPALYVLWLVIGWRLFGGFDAPSWSRRHAMALALLVFLASAGAVLEFKTSLLGYRVAAPDLDATPEVHAAYADRRIGWQYLGEARSFFFRRLARPARP